MRRGRGALSNLNKQNEFFIERCYNVLFFFFVIRYPLLSEKTMEFIYKLCKKPDTHSRVMSYLRTTTIGPYSDSSILLFGFFHFLQSETYLLRI